MWVKNRVDSSSALVNAGPLPKRDLNELWKLNSFEKSTSKPDRVCR